MKRATPFPRSLLAFPFAAVLLLQQVCAAEPNPEIISRLEEILKIRDSQLQEEKLIEELGRSDIEKMGRLKVATLDVKIELATERGDPDKVAAYLEEKIEVYQDLIKRMEAMSNEGRRALADLAPIRIALLETEIQLLRLQED